MESAERELSIVASSPREGYAFFTEAGNNQLFLIDVTADGAVPVSEGWIWRMLDSDSSLEYHQRPISIRSQSVLRERLARQRRNAWIDEALVDISRGTALFPLSVREVIISAVEQMLSEDSLGQRYDAAPVLRRILVEQGVPALPALFDVPLLTPATTLVALLLDGIYRITGQREVTSIHLRGIASKLINSREMLDGRLCTAAGVLLVIGERLARHEDPKAAQCYRVGIELLRTALEWDEVVDATDGLRVITALWHANLQVLDERILWKSLKPLNGCAKALEKSSKGPLFSRDIANVSLGVVRAYLLTTRIREIGSAINVQIRLGNLIQALIVADRAGFLRSQSRQLEKALLAEIETTIRQLPAVPEELLTLHHLAGRSTVPKKDATFDLYLNAADALRFAAVVRLNFRRELGEALLVLERAETYYLHTRRLLDVKAVPGRRKLLFHRWARKLMLEADVLWTLSLGKRDEALSVCDRALDLLRSLGQDDLEGSGDLEVGTAANSILQAEILLKKSRIAVTVDLSSRQELEETIRSLILNRPDDSKPRTLLLDYYTFTEGSTDAALRQLDTWIESWRDDPLKKPSLEYLQYTAARFCAERIDDDPLMSLAAVERYAAVLRDQATNTKATAELIELLDRLPEWQLSGALQTVDRILDPLSIRSCPMTHATVRLLFAIHTEHSTFDAAVPAGALAVLLNGYDNFIVEANVTLEREARAHHYVRTLLELVSKTYFLRGRASPSGPDIEIADRVLSVARASDPEDAVWFSRAIEIALLCGRVAKAELLMLERKDRFPDDPIIELQSARMQIATGRLTEAASTLQAMVHTSVGQGLSAVHPAVVDRLAFIAFRERRFDEAESLYSTLLREHPLDAAAHFGIGRVSFERGVDSWPDAFDHWLLCARLRAQSEDARDSALAWRTVCSIAGLFDGRLVRPTEDGNVLKVLESRLQQALSSEDPSTASLLVDALTVLGIATPDLRAAVLAGVEHASDLRLLRRVAHFLMAQTIYGLLGVGAEKPDVPSAIDWCQERGLLAEYLAGAKGSYARALVRLWLSREKSGPGALKNLAYLSGPFQTHAEWEIFFGHISAVEYRSNYYGEAYSIAQNFKYLTTTRLVELTHRLVGRVAGRVWETSKISKDPLGGLVSAVNLWPLGQVLHLEPNNSSSVGGWVDLDALRVEERVFAANGWQIIGTELLREIPRTPTDDEARSYGRFGLTFRQEVHSDRSKRSFCCIQTHPNDELYQVDNSY